MEEDAELVRAFLSQLEQGRSQVRKDVGWQLNFLKAQVDTPSDTHSGELKYAVNWIKEGIPDQTQVEAGDRLFEVIAWTTEGVKVAEETKVADEKGKLLVVKRRGLVEKGENVAVVVTEKDPAGESEITDADESDSTPEGEEDTGAIYVLRNDEMPNVLKIGYTEDSPEERARDISNSDGVPSDYDVAYRKEVPNPEQEEKRVHIELAEHRTTPKREFFRVSLERAKKAIEEEIDSSKSGFLCILENEEIPDLILIDSSEKTPTERVKIISEGTGVPVPYEVVFKTPSENHIKIYWMVRKELLKYKEYNRFYSVESEVAIKVIKKCKSRYQENKANI